MSAFRFLAMAAALLLPVGAQAQTRSAETVLMSENERYRADQERYGFSDAVIAGDLATIRELIHDGATGLLVPPDDVAALTLALRTLAADPPRRHTLGMAAREDVAAEFGDAINLDRLEAAFDAAPVPR